MTRIFKPLCLTVIATLAACGGGEEAPEASQPETEVPGATSASSGGLEGCYLQGTMEEALARTSPIKELGLVYQGGAGLLCYGAPSARGRRVMDAQVVPYDALWRLGANEATGIHLTAPASVGGVEVDPGSYSMYALPGEGQWQFFLNTNFERWGIPISDEVRATEVGSFTAVPETADEMVETLTFSYEADPGNAGGTIVMAWEHTRLRIPLAGR
ncbi:MAG: DUF2911 domain-containing protein [Gemmatimonadota bacterium]|nr:DUF2911 domain-containing protein [Gemmatimonadota bacterium]